MATRDANTAGGSLESGTSYKKGITGLPNDAAVNKANQIPPHEKDTAAGNGQKIRSNSQGY